MSSGFKNLQFNTQERAISPDVNRLQKFAGADTAELFRYLLDVIGNADITSGRIAEPNTIETPLRGEIIAGLMVKPQLASTDVQVDPGACFLMSPDAAADESNYKFIRDAGVPTNGTLSIAANGTGSIRIDVVECQMNPVNIVVSDSRDIFNATTGLFSAALVTKETQGRLEYRVRQGTPGSGMPANVSGWLPLCVAHVPAGSSNNDTCTFWDVRPLLEDRNGTISNRTSTFPRLYRRLISRNSTYPGAQKGYLDIVFKNRRVGGKLGICVPGTDTDQLLYSSHLASGIALTSGNIFYTYLLFPAGLPRWARYTDSGSGARLPRNPCGIYTISTVIPDAAGNPSSAVNLPTASGLGVSTTNGIVAWVGSTSSTPSPIPIQSENRRIISAGEESTVPQFGATGDIVEFRFTPGVHYPINARRLYGTVKASFTGSAAGDNIGELAVTDSTGILQLSNFGVRGLGGAGNVQIPFSISLRTFYPDAPAATYSMFWQPQLATQFTATGVTYRLFIDGWDVD